MRAVIVIPTVRENSLLRWLDEWSSEFDDHIIIVVEDNPKKSFNIPSRGNIRHYSWQEIDREMKEYAWIIPRRTDCIRSFGFWKAYQMSPDMVVTLDDDCYPDHENFLRLHQDALEKEHRVGWFQHYPGIRVRGVPISVEKTKTVLNIGLWSNIADLDAETQLENPNHIALRHEFNYPAPVDYFVPVCGMNLAFRPEIIPAFYFLLMGQGYEYDRFGDIWSGIFLKKICDHLKVSISGGTPFVRHERASDPLVNLIKEKGGKIINEKLWKDVQETQLEGSSFRESYLSLAQKLPEYSPYWVNLKKAMTIWSNLF